MNDRRDVELSLVPPTLCAFELREPTPLRHRI
jgi:hypothetical protein